MTYKLPKLRGKLVVSVSMYLDQFEWWEAKKRREWGDEEWNREKAGNEGRRYWEGEWAAARK